MTLDEAIEIFDSDTAETILNLSELQSKELAEWLKELKIYRIAVRNCEKTNFTVQSKGFAEIMKEWITEIKKEQKC